MRSSLLPLSLVVALAFVAGCADREMALYEPSVRTGSVVRSPFSGTQDQNQTIDDLFDELAQRVPGFGGLFVDSTDRLNVWLVDTTTSAEARAAIRSVLGWLPGNEAQGLAVRSGRYSFSALRSWMRTILRTVDVGQVVVGDIDERNNELFFGVTTAVDLARLGEGIAALGIPVNAFRVAVVEAPRPLATQAPTLVSHVRPVVGGLGIEVGTLACTLGFNATLPSDTSTYFVTNSHCAQPFGTVEGDTVAQPVLLSGSFNIGHEVADPPFVPIPSQPDCPYGVLVSLQ